MVCLCGRMIHRNLPSLLDYNSKTLLYQHWQQFPAEKLYNEISAYNTFQTMLNSLSLPEANAAVILLRSHFTGYLDNVAINDKAEVDLADFLTAEGVLLK